jgi:hypothetical protein
MSKVFRLTHQNLLNAVQRFPPHIQGDDARRSFQLSVAIVAHFFDEEWIKQHVSPASSAAGFLRLIPGESLETQLSTFRIVDFAEILWNLQDIDGFDLCIERMAKGNIEATYAELDFGRMLYVNDVNFRFVEPQQKKGSDFDIEIILADGLVLCGDAKCKIETTEFSEATVMNSLSHARKQFPSDRPSIVFVKIPSQWLLQPAANRSLNEIAQDFLRGTGRIVSVKYYTSTVAWKDGWITHDHIFAEISNPNNRFDAERDWRMFASPRKDNHWNGMPPRWRRLIYFPRSGP